MCRAPAVLTPVHDAVTVGLGLGKSPLSGHCPGSQATPYHFDPKLFSPMELPMPQNAKHEPFSRLAADVALEHPGLKAIRETKGYSIEELSLTCGLSTSEIADIESGKDIDPSKLRRIAAALQLPETALIDAPAPTAPVENRSVS
ncbi:helix-turn-helix domain-containing protein [Mesorhizobium sp. PL10]